MEPSEESDCSSSRNEKPPESPRDSRQPSSAEVSEAHRKSSVNSHIAKLPPRDEHGNLIPESPRTKWRRCEGEENKNVQREWRVELRASKDNDSKHTCTSMWPFWSTHGEYDEDDEACGTVLCGDVHIYLANEPSDACRCVAVYNVHFRPDLETEEDSGNCLVVEKAPMKSKRAQAKYKRDVDKPRYWAVNQDRMKHFKLYLLLPPDCPEGKDGETLSLMVIMISVILHL